MRISGWTAAALALAVAAAAQGAVPLDVLEQQLEEFIASRPGR